MYAGLVVVFILFPLSFLIAVVSAVRTRARWESWSPFDRAVGITPFMLLLLIGLFALWQANRPHLGNSGQTIPGSARTHHGQSYDENLAKRFAMGSTNVPLLKVHLFQFGSYSCEVDRFGNVTTYISDVPQKLEHPWPPLSQRGQPWSPLTTTNLDTTNLELLVETINQLPPSTTKPISIDRQIHVSGMRSNRWFQVHYNITNPPDEVGRLYDIMHVPFRSKPKTQAGSMAPVK